MKAAKDIRKMLNSLTGANPSGIEEMDPETFAIYVTLLWFMGERGDRDLKQYWEAS